uniref:Secreted protein n=1 Tax=Meloidogyne incognita TaxID=6306 RepID=A0A914NH78_MELIC
MILMLFLGCLELFLVVKTIFSWSRGCSKPLSRLSNTVETTSRQPPSNWNNSNEKTACSKFFCRRVLLGKITMNEQVWIQR